MSPDMGIVPDTGMVLVIEPLAPIMPCIIVIISAIWPIMSPDMGMVPVTGAVAAIPMSSPVALIADGMLLVAAPVWSRFQVKARSGMPARFRITILKSVAPSRVALPASAVAGKLSVPST